MHIGFNSSPTPIYGGAGPVNPKMATDAKANASAFAAETTDGVANVRPLSVAWAPVTFVQADADGNNGLTSDEFAQELSRVGVGADVAKKLFDGFDKSKDGSLSMNEFVDGVTADNTSGSSTFQDLAASYETDESAMTSFMNKGSAAASQYWNGIRDSAKSLLAIA